MSKKITIVISSVVLALSACTENDRVMNHATGTYYDLDRANGDWKPLFGHLTRVKTKLDEGWMK